MRSTTLLSIFSLLLVSASCSSLGVAPPNTDLMYVNAPGKRLRGYNLARDYDAAGNRLPTAKAKVMPLNSFADINGWACTSPDGIAEVKRAYDQLKAQVESIQGQLASCRQGR